MKPLDAIGGTLAAVLVAVAARDEFRLKAYLRQQQRDRRPITKGRRVSKGQRAYFPLTPEAVHTAADAVGVPWDNDLGFMAWTEALTGKRHLDAMTGRELQLVINSLGPSGHGGRRVRKYTGRHGVQEHRYMSGGAKTVCTSYVLAAFGIPPDCYHYSGRVDQRAAILRKYGFAVRSRDSRVGLNKSAKGGKVSVAHVAKAIDEAWIGGPPGHNAWGDPRGTRYMLRVKTGKGTHAILLDEWGDTIVDTAPRRVDRRPVLKIQAVFLSRGRRAIAPASYVLGGHTYDLTDLNSFPNSDWLGEFYGTQAVRDEHMPSVFNMLTALRFPLRVYRGIGLPPGEQPRIEQHGEYDTYRRGSWTFSRAKGIEFATGAEEGWGLRGDVPWLLTGIVKSAKDVDWPNTVNFNLRFDTEQEIVVRPSKVKAIALDPEYHAAIRQHRR